MSAIINNSNHGSDDDIQATANVTPIRPGTAVNPPESEALVAAKKYIEAAPTVIHLLMNRDAARAWMKLGVAEKRLWTEAASGEYKAEWKINDWKRFVEEVKTADAAIALAENGGLPTDSDFVANKDGLPDTFIETGKDQLRDIAGKVLDNIVKGEAASTDGQTIFVRENVIVKRRVTDDGSELVLEEVEEAEMEDRITRTQNLYERIEKRDEETGVTYPVIKATTPQVQWVRNCLQRGHEVFPKVQGVRAAPVWLPDRKLVQKPGYDADSGYIIYYPDGAMQPVNMNPSRDEVLASRDWLNHHIFSGFKYDTQASRANAFAAYVSPAVREHHTGLPPVQIYESPVFGSGKSLNGKIVVYTYTGRDPKAISDSTLGKPDDLRKELHTRVLENHPFIFFDDITKVVGGGDIQMFLTSNVIGGRLLGTNTTRDGKNQTTPILTSNNARLSPDMTRRSFRIRIDTGLANPSERNPDEFVHGQLLQWLVGNYVEGGKWYFKDPHRLEALHHIHTLWAGWFAADCPTAPDAVNLAGYEQWCSMLAGLLHWLDIPGFLGNQASIREEMSPEMRQWVTFAREWWLFRGSEPTTTAWIAERIKCGSRMGAEEGDGWSTDAIPLALGDPDKLTGQKLGSILETKANAPLGPEEFTFTPKFDKSAKMNRWRLIRKSENGPSGPDIYWGGN